MHVTLSICNLCLINQIVILAIARTLCGHHAVNFHKSSTFINSLVRNNAEEYIDGIWVIYIRWTHFNFYISKIRELQKLLKFPL